MLVINLWPHLWSKPCTWLASPRSNLRRPTPSRLSSPSGHTCYRSHGQSSKAVWNSEASRRRCRRGIHPSTPTSRLRWRALVLFIFFICVFQCSYHGLGHETYRLVDLLQFGNHCTKRTIILCFYGLKNAVCFLPTKRAACFGESEPRVFLIH